MYHSLLKYVIIAKYKILSKVITMLHTHTVDLSEFLGPQFRDCIDKSIRLSVFADAQVGKIKELMSGETIIIKSAAFKVLNEYLVEFIKNAIDAIKKAEKDADAIKQQGGSTTPISKEMTIGIIQEDDKVTITFHDDGASVPEDKLGEYSQKKAEEGSKKGAGELGGACKGLLFAYLLVKKYEGAVKLAKNPKVTITSSLKECTASISDIQTGYEEGSGASTLDLDTLLLLERGKKGGSTTATQATQQRDDDMSPRIHSSSPGTGWKARLKKAPPPSPFASPAPSPQSSPAPANPPPIHTVL
jgi:signal transduction histidine kinase